MCILASFIMNSTAHVSNYTNYAMMEWKWAELSTLTLLTTQHRVQLPYHVKTALMTWRAIMMLCNVNFTCIIQTNDAEQWQSLTHSLPVWFRSRARSCLLHCLCPRRLKRRLWTTRPPMTSWTRPPPSPPWWPRPMRAPRRPTPLSRLTQRFITLYLVTLCHHLLTSYSLLEQSFWWIGKDCKLKATEGNFLNL